MATPLIQSVERSLEILRITANTDGAISLHQLAATMGLNPTTVFNIARTLVAKGYLTKTLQPSGYTLGPAVGELLSATQKNTFERRAVQAIHFLSHKLNLATIVLSKYIAGEIVVTLRASYDQPGTIQRPSQQILSPYTSASSLTFLTFGDEESKDKYCQLHPFEDYAHPKWTNQKELNEFLEKSKKLGYIQNSSEKNFYLAFPILSDGNQLTAILGVSIAINNDSQIIEKVTSETLEAVRNLKSPNSTVK